MELSTQKLSQLLDPLGVNLHYFKETSSTNTCAKEAPASGASFDLFITECQSSGYGQHQRAWSSPLGNLAMTLLARRPDVYNADRYKMPLVVGIAVRRAIAAVVVSGLSLKWPNDIFVDGRKIGGILIENAAGESLAIGIGLNVNSQLSDFEESVRPERMTLLEKLGHEIDREELVVDIVKNIQQVMKELKRGNWNQLIEEYRQHSFLTRKPVNVSDGSTGTVLGIADDGQLQVRLADGSLRLIAAGDVSVKPL